MLSASRVVLAGKLVTDIPKNKKPNKRDTELVQHILDHILQSVRENPLIREVGIWRPENQPQCSDHVSYDPEEVRRKAERCVVVVVRVDP